MILVLNLNGSVDKRYDLIDMTPGTVMRAKGVQSTAGGKGLHVAQVAHALGEDTLTTGFLGGRAGDFIKEETAKKGLPGDYVDVAGETRSCLALLPESGEQTEILEPGPDISAQELNAFRAKFTELLAKADLVVASGSLPKGVPHDFYAQLGKEAKAAGKKFLLDTSGQSLVEGLKGEPYFIKPNETELLALTGGKADEDVTAQRLKELQAQGMGLAVVSLGASGSLACSDGVLYRVTVPHIECKNPVGSGDSFVAGVATALVRGYGVEDTLRLAAACGTANAMEAESGFVRREVVESLLSQIKVTVVEA